MMRRKKARKSREDRPQTGGSELFQALKEAVDAKNNETNDNGDDLESLKVSDEEQEEKEEDLEDEEAPERNKTSLKQSAFKPRARPKPKLFVDEPNNAEQVSSKRREPEGSSGDSSAVAVKQQVDRLQDPGTSQASNPSSPRRQPKRYISKGSEKSGQRRGTGYIWDAQSSGNQVCVLRKMYNSEVCGLLYVTCKLKDWFQDCTHCMGHIALWCCVRRHYKFTVVM